MKLTVKEYASRLNISVQSVYQRIAKGTLKYTIENDIKYVLVEPELMKEVKQVVDNDLTKDLFKLLKQKDKEIRNLNKQLRLCSKSKEDVLLQYISELKHINLIAHDPIEVKSVKKKKKKKR